MDVPLWRRLGLPLAREPWWLRKSRTPKVKATLKAEAPLASSSGHVGDTALEFILQLREPPRSRLRLPEAFARVLEVDQPPRLRLHMKGCCHGDMWVNTGFPAPQVMLLCRGWKTFAHAHCLMDGHVLCFKLAESDLLSVKVFGRSGHRLGCCAESSTDGENSSLCESGEEDSDNDNRGSGQEDDGYD